MTEELKNPFVNLPRAIYLSLPMVTAIYLFANISYLAVLGPVGVMATEAIAVVSFLQRGDNNFLSYCNLCICNQTF